MEFLAEDLIDVLPARNIFLTSCRGVRVEVTERICKRCGKPVRKFVVPALWVRLVVHRIDMWHPMSVDVALFLVGDMIEGAELVLSDRHGELLCIVWQLLTRLQINLRDWNH
ncbi:MAG: hypothetical protein EBT15_12020 [Betaproteobacteria bacterium]|nr:hypothetical protein [Betaproteobacteria bacterium]